MTEAEWLECTSPAPMLGLLQARVLQAARADGRIRDRKVRLLACACCRGVWHLLRDPRSRRAVEVAERFADGLAGEGELCEAGAGAWDAAEAPYERLRYRFAAQAAYAAAGLYDDWVEPWNAWGLAALALQDAASVTTLRPDDLARRVEAPAESHAYGVDQPESALTDLDVQARTVALIRDVFGNPFRPVLCEPGWCTSDVAGLAQGIYEERAFERLPIFADALMDAGCTDEVVLAHCRGPGPHVPGCWVVDLVRGVE